MKTELFIGSTKDFENAMDYVLDNDLAYEIQGDILIITEN